jgi:hypothetical protein
MALQKAAEVAEAYQKEEARARAQVSFLDQARFSWVTLRVRWLKLRARWAKLRVRWVKLRARWANAERSFAG